MLSEAVVQIVTDAALFPFADFEQFALDAFALRHFVGERGSPLSYPRFQFCV